MSLAKFPHTAQNRANHVGNSKHITHLVLRTAIQVAPELANDQVEVLSRMLFSFGSQHKMRHWYIFRLPSGISRLNSGE